MSLGLEKKVLSTTLPSLTPFSPSLEDFHLIARALVRVMTYAKNGMFCSLVFTGLLKKSYTFEGNEKSRVIL